MPVMTLSIRPGGYKTVLRVLKALHGDWQSITWTIGDKGKDPVLVSGTGVPRTLKGLQVQEVVE